MILEIAAALVVGGATAGWFYERRHAAMGATLDGALERIENAADAIHDHMLEMHDAVAGDVSALHEKLDVLVGVPMPPPNPAPGLGAATKGAK